MKVNELGRNKKGGILYSRQSIQSYILTYSRFTGRTFDSSLFSVDEIFISVSVGGRQKKNFLRLLWYVSKDNVAHYEQELKKALYGYVT